MMFFFSFARVFGREWNGMGASVCAVTLVRLTELLVGALDWVGWWEGGRRRRRRRRRYGSGSVSVVNPKESTQSVFYFAWYEKLCACYLSARVRRLLVRSGMGVSTQHSDQRGRVPQKRIQHQSVRKRAVGFTRFLLYTYIHTTGIQ